MILIYWRIWRAWFNFVVKNYSPVEDSEVILSWILGYSKLPCMLDSGLRLGISITYSPDRMYPAEVRVFHWWSEVRFRFCGPVKVDTFRLKA